jgi:hypothetical protein
MNYVGSRANVDRQRELHARVNSAFFANLDARDRQEDLKHEARHNHGSDFRT